MIGWMIGWLRGDRFPYDSVVSGGKGYDAFISYNSSDVLKVRHVVEQLLAAGHVPWFAEYCIAAAKWSDDDAEIERHIREGMAQSEHAIVFSSDTHADSPWCHFELESIVDSCIEIECSPISEGDASQLLVAAPALGDDIDTLTVASVLVSPGDVVESGQSVVAVETDKAVAELPSPSSGRVVEVYVREGDSVPVGDRLLLVDTARPYAHKVSGLLSRIPHDRRTRLISFGSTLDFITHAFRWKGIPSPSFEQSRGEYNFDVSTGWRIDLGGWRHVGEMNSAHGSLGPLFERIYDNIPARLNIMAGPVKGETLPFVVGENDDRAYRKVLTAAAREYSVGSKKTLRGTHLIHVGGRGHFAETSNSGSTWIRKYTLSFPMPRDVGEFKEKEVWEVVLTFSVRGSFRDFCRHAWKFDKTVETFTWKWERTSFDVNIV